MIERSDGSSRRLLNRSVKRLIDLTAAVTAFVVLSPLILALALLIRLGMGSPVLFRQVRPGLNGKPFTLVKFRTMTGCCDPEDNLLPDSQRLTRLGKSIRRASLDELPQLWNVLTGNLSLVGPRPLLMQYLERYSPEQARRHEVKPGITGWAQVNGRNALTWEEKFAHDVWYVDNWSLWLDIKILWKTVALVVTGEGISAEGEATMFEFMGSRQD